MGEPTLVGDDGALVGMGCGRQSLGAAACNDSSCAAP
jgi:hypothetical protein